MLTALLDDKADFVELFLSNGLSMSEFLSTEILCQLYAAVSYSIIHLSNIPHDFHEKGGKYLTAFEFPSKSLLTSRAN